MRLYDAADGKKVVATLIEGEAGTALNGELHVKPRKARVVLADLYDAAMPKGDTLYLIRPFPDGTWKVWYRGDFVTGVREIWDRAQSAKVRSTWWVRLQTSYGVAGWTKETGAFDGTTQGNCEPR